jgi:hypothetical protein
MLVVMLVVTHDASAESRDEDRAMRLATLPALICVALALVFAAPAAADSLVFVKSNNVWLSNADGSGQFQVTFDGTPSSPYSSPSQADDGTIMAVRQPPGQRNQLFRMSQAGLLLNPPINTPAPGPAGAIDAKISPDGTLAAYWFVTTVNDPTCAFCVNVASETLLTHSDRFTKPDEMPQPNTGIMPSWMSNNMLLLSQGAADQWYYQLGTPEGQQWFDDSLMTSSNFQTLDDSEAARTGDRVAVVRGNNAETIVILAMNGPPPTAPTPKCELDGATGGKFFGPTWSQNGQTLAWQEGDGIWSGTIPDLNTCTVTPALIAPGGSDPDFGPAAVNPGPRPPCGNPGNPVACPPPVPPCGNCNPPTGVIKASLRSLLGAESRALRKLGIRGLLSRRQVKVSFTAPGPGGLAASLAAKTITNSAAKVPAVLGSGRLTFAAAGKKTLVVKLGRKGRKLLRHARKAKLTLSATFTPQGGAAATVKKSVALKR